MTDEADIEIAHEICAPTLVQRVAALLDRDPAALGEGDPLPRGWHAALFTVSTPQSRLRPDGVGGLGFTIPPSDLPRMVLGGRRTRFLGDIAIGSRLRRESRIVAITDKQGRSGPLRLFTVQHRIFAEGESGPVLEEEQDYIQLSADPAPGTAAQGTVPAAAPLAQPGDLTAGITFDEVMLFRYSAITFNAHRIHFDKDYVRDVEGYPAPLVNGGLSALFLLEMLKSSAGGAVQSYTTRNLAPLYCGQTVRMQARQTGAGWALSIEDGTGRRILEATATF